MCGTVVVIVWLFTAVVHIEEKNSVHCWRQNSVYFFYSSWKQEQTIREAALDNLSISE